MAKNKTKQKFMGTPVENHQTAAWTNIEKTQEVSQIPHPSDLDAEYAKEWVEINQK